MATHPAKNNPSNKVWQHKNKCFFLKKGLWDCDLPVELQASDLLSSWAAVLQYSDYPSASGSSSTWNGGVGSQKGAVSTWRQRWEVGIPHLHLFYDKILKQSFMRLRHVRFGGGGFLELKSILIPIHTRLETVLQHLTRKYTQDWMGGSKVRH